MPFTQTHKILYNGGQTMTTIKIRIKNKEKKKKRNTKIYRID